MHSVFEIQLQGIRTQHYNAIAALHYCRWLNYCAVVAAVLVLLWLFVQCMIEPEYSVEIAAVSDLDPATDLNGRATVDPVFRLSVSVASQSWFFGACIDPHTVVKVSYSHLRLPLAAGHAPEVCVGPKELGEKRTVVARGVGVSVPGYMLDNLPKT
uniref:Uncharacterized protein n=1 Tax=Leersia perrieri TaxID=77586 RepID=A0A0D9VIE3_9ORYZ